VLVTPEKSISHSAKTICHHSTAHTYTQNWGRLKNMYAKVTLQTLQNDTNIVTAMFNEFMKLIKLFLLTSVLYAGQDILQMHI